MNKFLAVALGILLFVAGITFSAGSVMATGNHDTPCVPADAYTEIIKAAYDETVIDVPGVDAIPGVDAVPGKDAVYQVLYQFEHAPNGKYKIKWHTNPNWNANGNPNSTGWRSTGVTKNGDLLEPAVPGKDAIPAVPAVPEQSHVVRHDAVTKDHAAVVCDDEPADAKGTIDMAWLLPDGAPADSNSPAIWPQTPYNGDYSPKCETYVVQQDRYQYDNQTELDAINAFDDDGVLSNGEDHAYVVSWKFVTVNGSPDKCAPVVPPKPDKVVTVVPEHAVDCTEYSERTTTTTIGWKLVNNEWLPRQPVIVVSDWVNSVPTAEQLEAGGLTDAICNPVVPPVDVPPVVTTPVVDLPPLVTPPVVDKPAVKTPVKVEKVAVKKVINETEALPNTGGASLLWLIIGLIAVAVGVAFIRRR